MNAKALSNPFQQTRQEGQLEKPLESCTVQHHGKYFYTQNTKKWTELWGFFFCGFSWLSVTMLSNKLVV